MWFALMGSHLDHDKVTATPSRIEGGDGASTSLPPQDSFVSPTALSFDGEEFDEEDDLLSLGDESSRSTPLHVNAARLADSIGMNERLPSTASEGIIRGALLDWIDKNKSW